MALPGDDRPDAELRALSTVDDADYAALWAFLVEGGAANAAGFLAHVVHGGRGERPRLELRLSAPAAEEVAG